MIGSNLQLEGIEKYLRLKCFPHPDAAGDAN